MDSNSYREQRRVIAACAAIVVLAMMAINEPGVALNAVLICWLACITPDNESWYGMRVVGPRFAR